MTAGALGWLFWKTPVGEVVAALRHAAPWTVPGVLLTAILIYVADSFAMWKTFGWFLAELPFRDVLVVRGATYLLAAINYSVGQGAIVYFVHRVRGVPVMRGVATVLLIMGTNLLVLLSFVTLGLALAGGTRPPALVPVVAVAWAGLAVYVAIVLARPKFLVSRPLFDVLLSAGLGGYLKAMLVRLPHIGALMLYQMVALRSLGVAIPFGIALATLPVVMFIAVLPISVQGLGTTQAAMVLFFAPYVPTGAGDPRAVILGASLAAQAIALGFQILVGFACLRTRTARGLGRAGREQSEPVTAAP